MDIKSFSTQLVRVLPLQKSSLWLSLLLLGLAAYQLASITWLLVPEDKPSFRWTPEPVQVSSIVTKIDLSSLNKLHLFGEFQAKKAVKTPEKVVSANNAPKTSLKLTLSGLVASSDQSKALAIIEHRGKQQTYGIDESIEGTQAVIKEIQAERIIILHKGNYESVLLDPDSKQASNNSNLRTQSPAAQPEAPIDVAEVLKDPSKLTDYIRVSPVREDGELVGYRVNPGKDAALFKQVGLEANDLAVALNGYDLRDNAQAMQVMQELPELSDVTVTVERDGQLQDVLFSLPEE
ncbi:type II secretion system protein GspC [Agarivorans gilvus]|uniref:Type II secretion system protein GspC n=1 Tax=Agarivorans gilvus TaxID=680279 RepID=A0ABQ1I385_9ALTE|nr:type II secretion system protein GspC [Agarivorans gilvus]GGB12231.1 type II secretion system protein GspC [Agarivorans gilvus]